MKTIQRRKRSFFSTNYYRNSFWFREIIMAGQDFFLDPSQFPENLLNSQNINELRVLLHNLFDDSKLPRCVMVAPIWPLWPFHNDAIPGLTMLPSTHSPISLYKAAWWQGCISCGTCSYPELTEDHVLTSAYVKIFRIVTRNAVNKSF